MSFILSTRAVTEASHVSVIAFDPQAQQVSAQVVTGIKRADGAFAETRGSQQVTFGSQSIARIHRPLAEVLAELERDAADTSLVQLLRFVMDRAIDEQGG